MPVAKPKLQGIPSNEKLAIDQKRILVIGGDSGLRRSQLHNLPNLREFGAIVLYISAVPNQAQLALPETKEAFLEIIDWVKEGHTLVVLGTMPDFSWRTKDPNSNSTQIFSLQESELFRGISFQRLNGRLVEFAGPLSIKANLERWTPHFAYDAILISQTLSPILRVSRQSATGPDQIVGGYRSLGSGTAVFLPILPTGQDPYHIDIVQIPSLLDRPAEERPAWALDYKTTAEKFATQKIDLIDADIDKLTVARGEFNSIVASEQHQKNLFTATGDILVDAAVGFLTKLGLKAIQGPRQRADVVAWDGSRLMAIEVKGLEGAAREGNLRQADRWKADILAALAASPEELATDEDLVSYRDCLSKLNVPLDDGRPTDCKGVMIINTYRKQSLRERGESFPDPVRKVIVRSNVCALTGLQLFGIGSKVADGSLSKASAVDELFSVSGVSELAIDWQTFLSR